MLNQNTHNSDQLKQVEFTINYENVKYILVDTLNPNNEIRNKMENLIISKKYCLNLYEFLIGIYNNSTEDVKIKMQSLFVLKNLIRIETSSNNRGNFKSLNQTFEINKEFKEIIIFVKAKLVEMINSGKYKGSDKFHIKEIILLICDKWFPQEYEELNNIFAFIYAFDVNNINTDNINAVIDISDLFFSILKQQNKKRTLSTRNRFFKVREYYINMITNFYQKYNSIFTQNFDKIENEIFLEKFFDLIIILDKTLLLLIDCSFNINDLYKDQSYINILKNSLNKGEFLVNNLNSKIYSKPVQILMKKNIYTLIKYLAKIQTIFPILFFDDFNQYMNLLISPLLKITNLNENIIKITLYALFKVFNTQLYKDNLKQDSTDNCMKENTPIKNNSVKKANNLKGVALIVSPTKLKNYENEIISVTSKFNDYFNDEALLKLLEINLSTIPSYFKNVPSLNNTNEIDMFIGETDDEIYIHDTFSQNTMNWQIIHRSLLRSIFETFTIFCLKYLKNKLEFVYKNSQLISGNFIEFEALVHFVNVIPYLYREGIIIEPNISIIDINKLLSFIQTLAASNEIFLKCYIITISKWSDVLILNETIFDYIHHLLEILLMCKNNLLLCESCIALKIIINNLDKHLKENKKFLVFEDKQKLQENIRIKINWAEVLKIVSRVGLNIINLSPDILLTIVNLFTLLIEKCHFQCESSLLDTIQSSSLLQIISQTTHEFGHNALIDMWKALLLLFQDNEVIINYSLEYISFCFSKEVDANNLSLLLFMLRVIEEKPNDKSIKNIILKFINNHYGLLLKMYSQYINNIIVNIFEEIVLFNIIDFENIGNIFEFCRLRILPALEMTNSLLQKSENKIDSNDFIFTDLCDYKNSIYSLLNSIFIKFYQEKNIGDIIKKFDIYLYIIFQELFNSKGKSSSIYTTIYITNFISLLNRISIFEFEFFKFHLNKYLAENSNVTYDIILSEWLKKMENIISTENRKINSIVVSNFLKLMSPEEFTLYFNQICNISLFTVHSVMNTKFHSNVDRFENSSNIAYEYKSFNIRISSRKNLMIKSDTLVNKIDIFTIFKESLIETLNKYNISFDTVLTKIIKNKSFVKRLNDIFGKNQQSVEEIEI